MDRYMTTYLTCMSRTTCPGRRAAVIAVLSVMLWGVWLLASGCSGHDDLAEPAPVWPGGVDEVQAGFYITVGDVPASTGTMSGRATPADGPYDHGQGYENYIDIPGRDFRFMFFSNTDAGPAATYIADMTVTSIIPVSGSASSKTYYVLGRVKASEIDPTQGFRVMVLANWGNYPEVTRGSTTIDRTCAQYNALFGFAQDSTVISAENPIPLFGINRYQASDIKFDPNYFCNLGTIHLIRAYAKVDVTFPDRRWAIKSAALTKCHTTGYKGPLGVYTQSDYVRGSYDEDYTEAPSIHVPTAGNAYAAGLKFTPVTADSSQWRIYMPEFMNLDGGTAKPDDERCRIALEFRDRHTGLDSYLGTQYVDFKYYQAPETGTGREGQHFNVMRNYWYRFTIGKGDEMAGATIQVDVQPYASVMLDPSFGLERDPIDGYIVLKKGTIDGQTVPTFMYDDRFDEYYDFQKYLLKSNYSTQIGRISEEKKTALGLKGDIWLIKYSNGKHDEVGGTSGQPSLLYDADTGIYYDYAGVALNLVYSSKLLFGGDINQPLTVAPDSVTELSRDFQHNDIALLRGESDRVAVYYDFSDGKYKGATDFDVGSFPRRELEKLSYGWIVVKPYEALMQKWVDNGLITASDKANVKPMYFNLYTKRFYDPDFYSLHSPGYKVEYYVDSPLVTLTKGSTVIYYNRVTATYLSSQSGPATSRPVDLKPSRVGRPAGL